MDRARDDVCGCGGTGQPAPENRPLYELKNLIAMLERQEEQRRQAEKKGDH
jgi:hypothetical protein